MATRFVLLPPRLKTPQSSFLKHVIHFLPRFVHRLHTNALSLRLASRKDFFTSTLFFVAGGRILPSPLENRVPVLSTPRPQRRRRRRRVFEVVHRWFVGRLFVGSLVRWFVDRFVDRFVGRRPKDFFPNNNADNSKV